MRVKSLIFAVVFFALSGAAPQPPHTLRLHLRWQQPTVPQGHRFRPASASRTWDLRKTAVIICDMWDRHWCAGATARVGELAPAIDETVSILRSRGALIVHCPSETMRFYAGAPQRLRAQSAPQAPKPKPFVNPRPYELPLPIDDSDGGCDSGQTLQIPVWRRENAAIHICPEDAITDDGREVYNVLKQRGIGNVLIMGVHANMCVLGRSFGIRKLVACGFSVALVRDLTDVMYNPARPPHVSHFDGIDLVVDHIERYWCPTILSTDITQRPRFRFAADPRR
jgi:nicotinamidase-related amidase